jgi:hypothetical protein
MADTFDRDGVRFQYPSGWQLETEEDGDAWTASLQSESTAFLVVSYVPGIEDPSELVEAAVEGLRAEYPNLDAEDAVDTLAGQPAIGADVNFVHFDLTNTCWIRAVPSGDGAVLVMAQCTDEELPTEGATLKQVMSSLSVAE